MEAALASDAWCTSTHPECASLFDPLFGKPERG